MQIKRLGDVEAFVRAPPVRIEGALIYGRDQGLVRERSKRLEAAILGPDPGPFQLVELGEAEIKDAPSALYSESAASVMLGGRKFIRLRMSGDAAASALAAYLAERESGAPKGDSFFVIEAGDIRPTSALRKRAEGSDLVAAIACFPDDESSLENLVDDALRAAGAAIEPAARGALLDRLGSDRGVSRQEIDKLLTYCGAGTGSPVTITRVDVLELVGDTGAAELDRLLDAMLGGDLAATVRMNARLAAGGTQPVRILRAVATHLDRLSALGASRGSERGYGYYQAEALRRHAARWPARKIARAQGIVLGAEMQCKTTGLPAAEICERTLLALARAARQAPAG